jgi:type 2 lantibiotic biosynthesis protein LanM
VDAHFQELVTWVNERGARPALRPLTVLDRGSYGWTEFARRSPCRSVEEVRRFYARQGSYLALLTVLEATDFHAGNIIASGEHPCLVDLEALFHPHQSGRESTDRDADWMAAHAVSNSVLRVGLLPERIFDGSETEAIDLSGLGTLDGQITEHGVAHWESPGTDAMHLVRKRPIQSDKNRPALQDAKVDVLDYRQQILEGFRATYSLLLAHREELLSDGGPLDRFRGDDVCVFLRSTRTYRRLLKESYHPDLLHDALDRDRHFDLLWIEVERRPELARVIASERADLLRGDIPVMITRPDSRDLQTSAGPIPDFFEEAGLSAARRRVRGMGKEDLERQSWLIEASLSTLSEDGPDGSAYPVTTAITSSDPGALRHRLLAAAQAVGDRLQTLAFRGNPGASWVGLQLVRGRFWSVDALDLDLYGGLPGVALYLAYLGAIADRSQDSALAESALVTMRRAIDDARPDIVRLGAFDGWGGIIYTLTHLGVLWQRPELIAQAEAMVTNLPGLIESDDDFDVCSGAAGCILALKGLHRYAPTARLVEVATKGDHLLAHAVPAGTGIGWRPSVGGSRPLAGLAHGAAGIAWALLELSAWTGEDRFRAAAAAAVRYERSLFVEDAGNWLHLGERRIPDSEDSEETSCLSTTWSHGAPGIGLARLRSLPMADDSYIRSEIAVAIETVMRHGFGRNHSLGHGDLGNLEVLVQASQILRDPKWKAHLERVTTEVLTSIETVGMRSAAPFNVETPGMMTGLAGTGLGLLRLAEPEWMPSVLVLDTPPPRKFHAR